MKIEIPCVAILIWLAGFPPVLAALTDQEQLSAANGDFAFKLLQQIAQEQPATNIFISPYSASTVLQIAATGAAGQTKTEMQQVLGTTDLSSTNLGEANKAIAQSLNSGNTNVILTTADAIWCRQGALVNPDFITQNQLYFGATIGTLDFQNPNAANVINQWASDQTHGRITQITDAMSIQGSRLFLANAVYFKGKWSDPFEANDTKDQPFYLRDGSQKTIPMMTKTKTFTYRRGTGYQAVRLPYEGENLAMYVFLPDTNSSPEKLLKIMSSHTWRKITKPGFSEKQGTLGLPKFKLEYSVGLNQPLKVLGMKAAFNPQAADFSGIAPQLYISSVLQKTFVEVKEEGTEAAAVTTMNISSSAMPMPEPNPFQMIVNRPFLFLIEDNSTGTILFMGVMFDPEN